MEIERLRKREREIPTEGSRDGNDEWEERDIQTKIKGTSKEILKKFIHRTEEKMVGSLWKGKREKYSANRRKGRWGS